MNLRKINALLGLICTVLLMNHAIVHAIWMLSMGRLPKLTTNAYQIVPWVLFGLMMVHAVVSIVLAILGHKGTAKGKYNGYAQLNRATIFQRMSGMLLIVFTTLHVAGTTGALQPPPLVHAILPPLFFTIALAHTAISTSKAFITLGIGSAKLIRAADIAVKALCAATLVAVVIGFYLYSV